jgi:hypothetical protein
MKSGLFYVGVGDINLSGWWQNCWYPLALRAKARAVGYCNIYLVFSPWLMTRHRLKKPPGFKSLYALQG